MRTGSIVRAWRAIQCVSWALKLIVRRRYTVPAPQSLIQVSHQGRRLTLVMTAASIGALVTLFGGKLDSLVSSGVVITVVAAGAFLFGGAIIFGLRTIKSQSGFLRGRPS